MHLLLDRHFCGDDCTLGALYFFRAPYIHSPPVNRSLLCYTLEDLWRGPDAFKVPGSTCIPDGLYRLSLRDYSPVARKYNEAYQDVSGGHIGMLWLQHRWDEVTGTWVPDHEPGGWGFQYVYMHTGNEDEDTRGCILLGNGQQILTDEKRPASGVLTESREAYRRVYPQLRDMVPAGLLLKVQTTAENDLAHM